MKQFRKASVLMLAFLLVFGLASNIFADKGGKGQGEKKKDREEISIDFKDISEAAWAREYIGKMQLKHVFQGFEDGTFRPNQPVTRVEAIVAAVRLMGLEDEAKAKPEDTKLHFKDANQIDHKYKWAKGYIAVALEHGLFDTSEDKIMPEKPASRVWVSALLVKSLGLQQDALNQMSVKPDFKDANAIPAGAVGYVNVAVERNLISGYPNGTFLPNKGVTRAELAALLDRTNDGINDTIGAVRVSGKITDIRFESANGSAETTGTVTVNSFAGGSFTYSISSQLPVKYGDRYIRADQLVKDDLVTFVVKDNKVLEAVILSSQDAVSAVSDVTVHIGFTDGQKYLLQYNDRFGRVNAKIVNRDQVTLDDAAVEQAKKLLASMSIDSDMSKEEVKSRVLSALNIAESSTQSIYINVYFSNGKRTVVDQKTAESVRVSGRISEIRFNNDETIGRISINSFAGGILSYDIPKQLSVKFGNSTIRADQLSVSHMVSLVVRNNTVVEAYLLDQSDIASAFVDFQVKIDFINKEQYSLRFHNEHGTLSAEIVNKGQTYKDGNAVALVKNLLTQMNLSSEMTKDEVQKRVLAALNVSDNSIQALKVNILFANGKSITVDKKFNNEPGVPSNPNIDIRKFELEAEYFGNGKIELEYENKDGKVKAEVEKQAQNKKKEKIEGQEAVKYMENFLKQANFTPDMTKQQAIDKAVSLLDLNEKNLKKLDIEIKFANGKEIEIETEKNEKHDEKHGKKEHKNKKDK